MDRNARLAETKGRIVLFAGGRSSSKQAMIREMVERLRDIGVEAVVVGRSDLIAGASMIDSPRMPRKNSPVEPRSANTSGKEIKMGIADFEMSLLRLGEAWVDAEKALDRASAHIIGELRKDGITADLPVFDALINVTGMKRVIERTGMKVIEHDDGTLTMEFPD